MNNIEIIREKLVKLQQESDDTFREYCLAHIKSCKLWEDHVKISIEINKLDNLINETQKKIDEDKDLIMQ